MDEITKKDVENIIYMNLSRYNLRKKGLASMKSLLRSIFALAYEEYWICDNVYLRVNFQKYEGMLEKDIPVESRCHSDEELKQMLAYIHEQQEKKPSYLPAYALEMQIIMGLRRGEIPPLEWKDVHNDCIEITKEQITVRKTKTDVVNSTGGNVIMASQLFGNSPDLAKKNYYTGTDMKNAVDVLNQRKLS